MCSPLDPCSDVGVASVQGAMARQDCRERRHGLGTDSSAAVGVAQRHGSGKSVI